MPDVISDTNGKLCVGSYHMWRLLSNPDNYSLSLQREHFFWVTGLFLSHKSQSFCGECYSYEILISFVVFLKDTRFTIPHGRDI